MTAVDRVVERVEAARDYFPVWFRAHDTIPLEELARLIAADDD
jgi:hypothetical protein